MTDVLCVFVISFSLTISLANKYSAVRHWMVYAGSQRLFTVSSLSKKKMGDFTQQQKATALIHAQFQKLEL